MSHELAITYLGWSGFRVDTETGPIFVDPPAQADIPSGRRAFVLLSHGHPEHLAGIRAHIERAGSAADVVVLASPALCDHLFKTSRRSALTFMPVRPGDAFELGVNLSVRIFEWTHLPLLPSGFAAKVRHVVQLASKPALALRIAWAGLTGPAAGPMLGFGINLGRWQIVAYGEGLHRFCEPEAIGETPQRTVALVGVEPGDEDVMPGLLRSCGAGCALLYEPHAKWRDAFGMAHVDLAALRDRIDVIGIAAQVSTPQGRFVLDS